MRGENEPAVSKIAALCRASGFSLDYLVYGQGNPKGSQSPLQPGAGYADIPLYDVRAKGGNGGSAIDDERIVNELAFREDWIRRELRTSPANLRLIHVEGDSMEPDLRAGDIILVDHTDTTARREGIYVIRMDDALLVKVLQRLPGGLINVASRNPAYQAFTVNVADIESSPTFSIIGRVVWACRRL